MPKLRTGSLKFDPERKRWEGRVQFKGADGKPRSQRVYADTKREANAALKKLLEELEQFGETFQDSRTMTFARYAEWFSTKYIQAAIYKDDRRIAGRRSVASAQSQLKNLVKAFEKRRLQSISYADLERYRLDRLQTAAIATVHRELALLRRMLNVALREGLIARNPFNAGESLISMADERHRTRVLSRDEEARLLAACDHPRRAHLRPIVIAAVDTGMRLGELLKMNWQDIDMESRTITIHATNTKTLKARLAPISDRLAQEFKRVWGQSLKIPALSVFGQDSIKRAWRSACLAAGIEDLHFHDLRHTAATRLERSGMSGEMIRQILGHSHVTMTRRYLNVTPEVLEAAASAVDRWHSEAAPETETVN